MTYLVEAPPERKIKPAFVVRKLEGTRQQTIFEYDAKKKKVAKTVEVPAGYLVEFPHRGHSIRVGSEKELARLGFDRTTPLLNSEGEAVGEIDLDVGDEE